MVFTRLYLPINTNNKKIQNGSVWGDIVYGEPNVTGDPTEEPSTLIINKIKFNKIFIIFHAMNSPSHF